MVVLKHRNIRPNWLQVCKDNSRVPFQEWPGTKVRPKSTVAIDYVHKQSRPGLHERLRWLPRHFPEQGGGNGFELADRRKVPRPLPDSAAAGDGNFLEHMRQDELPIPGARKKVAFRSPRG